MARIRSRILDPMYGKLGSIVGAYLFYAYVSIAFRNYAKDKTEINTAFSKIYRYATVGAYSDLIAILAVVYNCFFIFKIQNLKNMAMVLDYEIKPSMTLIEMDKLKLNISVILDTDDNFYELDIFKGDFSPLKVSRSFNMI
ncbi:MAG: hypothetical protein WC623_12240 [Pedobacter sp.]|uniref:DUF6984 family protein n=1 Tax=Pedobacter sp. TaxID=1411316 RepID=UPI003568E665